MTITSGLRVYILALYMLHKCLHINFTRPSHMLVLKWPTLGWEGLRVRSYRYKVGQFAI